MGFSNVFVALASVQLLMVVSNADTHTVQQYCSGSSGSFICESANSYAVWSGSAFTDMCPDQNDSITLRNIGASESLTCGIFTATFTNIIASGPQVVHITSRLRFISDVSLNGTEVICSDATLAEIRSISLQVDVSPGPIAVVFNQSGEPHYTVDWSPLTDIPLDLADTYSYFVEVQGDDCGCLSQNLPSNVTNLVCSGWEANGQMCTISVRARSTSNRICPRPSSPNQPTRISILLQAPGIPMVVKITPIYSVDGPLKAVEVPLYEIEEVALEVPGNFIFSYTHSSGETCTNVIAVSDCVFLSTCRDENIDSCPFSANARMNGTLTLTIVAENAVGQSQPTIPTTFTSSNQLFLPRVNLAARKINCQLYEIQPSVYGRLEFVSQPGCIHLPFFLLESTSHGQVTDVELSLPDELFRPFTYCFLITVNTSSVSSAIVEGRFKFDCDAKKLGTKPYEAECDEESSSFGIAGGSVCYNGATVGSAATYSCLNCGYTLQGSDTRRCLMDDTWSGRTPLCDCRPDLPLPPNVECAYRVLRECITANYIDNSDVYELIGNSTITFDCASGRWSDPPSCEVSHSFTPRSLTTGAIVGIAVSGVVLVLLLILFFTIACLTIVIKSSRETTVSAAAEDIEMTDNKGPVPKDSEPNLDDAGEKASQFL